MARYSESPITYATSKDAAASNAARKRDRDAKRQAASKPAAIRSGMSDYDVQVRQDYNKKLDEKNNAYQTGASAPPVQSANKPAGSAAHASGKSSYGGKSIGANTNYSGGTGGRSSGGTGGRSSGGTGGRSSGGTRIYSGSLPSLPGMNPLAGNKGTGDRVGSVITDKSPHAVKPKTFSNPGSFMQEHRNGNLSTAGMISVPAGAPQYGADAAAAGAAGTTPTTQTPAAAPTRSGTGAVTIRSGMSDYDVQVRQKYAEWLYDNAKKTDYLDAMAQQTTEDSFTPPEEPVYKRYQQAEDALAEAEKAAWDKLHEFEDYDAAYTANHSVSDLLYLEKTKAEFNDLYKTYTDAKDQYEQFYSADGGASVIESLDAELSKIAEELERNQKLLAALDRIPGSRAQCADLLAKIDALQTQYSQYSNLRTEVATSYYHRENESQFEALGNDEHATALYTYAQTTENDMKRLENVISYWQDPAAADAAQANTDLAYLQEKYGLGKTVTEDALYQILLNNVTQAETYLAENGFNYDRMAGYDQMLADKEAAEARAAEWAAYAEEHPGWATLGTVLAAPARGLDYVTTMIGGIGTSDPGDYRNYVPMNTYNMNTTNYVNAVRGTVADQIDSKIGKFLYQVGVSAADSAVMLGVSAVTGLPAIATVSMGMSAASDQAKDIIERGGTNRQAFWGGLAAGVAEAVCEKIPLDNLLNATSADDVKGLLTNVFKHQLIEGGEEMVTEIANIISDAVIMKDNSKFNNRVDTYMAGGMSAQEAKQKATMDAISDVALAGAGGFAAGGLLDGAVNIGKYSGALQNAGSRSGNNIPILSKYTANSRGAAGTVTMANGNTKVQQGGSQTAGGTAVVNGGVASNTNTQASNNGNSPTAVTGSGAVQTGTSANTQMPTAVQQQAQTDTRIGKSIKAEGKVTELLQKAMAQPADSPARQLAETLIAQQETALVEQGLELGSQYQVSHAEQARLAAETANNALPEQAIGELTRLLQPENIGTSHRKDTVLKTPGEYGEKAIPYSERGIDMGERLNKYREKLAVDGSCIVADAGTFKSEDLAALTTETGAEYTALTIGGKSYLVRGQEKSTTIPQELLDILFKEQGTLDCHSHPFIGDLTPSENDKDFLRMLTWQKESLIIDPTQRVARFTPDGVVEIFNAEVSRSENYYELLFGKE